MDSTFTSREQLKGSDIVKNDLTKRAVAAALFTHEHGEPWQEATWTARLHWLDMADVAIRAMDRSDTMPIVHQLANILDGVLPLLEAAAEQERRDNEGKAIKCITQRNRLAAGKLAVDRAFDILGMSHD